MVKQLISRRKFIGTSSVLPFIPTLSLIKEEPNPIKNISEIIEKYPDKKIVIWGVGNPKKEKDFLIKAIKKYHPNRSILCNLYICIKSYNNVTYRSNLISILIYYINSCQKISVFVWESCGTIEKRYFHLKNGEYHENF